ncbi:hypothetical protein BSY239_4188 [Hydrogenophaga sp. RAC07]|uniref:PglL family O-oligosaccharyltransferase n=1 Tax=Hydrogenophaga sp. RAC07 TaxID=1842537 RepID=UPI00083D7F19|nr:O-antigen ligase family protein [Hydrogenophaga sp. RAC07]AOF84627.1 hypothetical protein BSY239_4188 [Hydrogenophaga sp. RAC07]
MSASLPLAWLSLFLCLAFLLPNHYSPWLSFHQEALAAVALVPLGIWAACKVQRVPWLTWLFLVLAVTPFLQWAFGLIPYGGDAWVHALYLMAAVWAMLAGYAISQRANTTAEHDELLKPLWLALIAAAIVSVGMAAHQWLDLGLSGIFIADLPPGGRPFANLAQPNHLASLLLLAIVGVWYGWEKKWLSTPTACLALVYLLIGTVLTGSRSVWLAIAWFVPVVAWAKARCGLRLKLTFLGTFVLFFFALSYAMPAIEVWLVLADTGAAVERLGQTQLRILAWRAFLDAAMLEPLWGYGWGQIGAAQFRVAEDHPGLTDIFFNTHNVVLDLVIWLGFPVAILCTLLLVWWLFKCLQRCRDANAFLSLMAVCIVFGHSMVEFPITYAYFLVPTSFWMGVVTAATEPAAQIERTKLYGRGRLVVVGASFATVAMLLVVTRDYLPFEEDWREQQFVEARIEGARTESLVQPRLLDQLQGMMQLQRYSPLTHSSPSDLQWVQDVAERYPYPSFRYKYALLLAMSGHSEAATVQLLGLCAVFSRIVCEQVKKDWAIASARDARIANVDLSGLP